MAKEITNKEIIEKIDELAVTTAQKIDELAVTTAQKIDELAVTTAKRFERIDKRFDKMASKEDLNELAIMVAKGFEETASKADLEDVKGRLVRIENLLIRDITNRIERLEDRTQIIETAIGTSGVR